MRACGVFISILSFISGVSAQNVGIGIDSFTPDGSAILELRSTTSGLLLPRMTQEERDLISSPALGLMVFQKDNSRGFYYYDGSMWQTFGASDNFGDHIAQENIELAGYWLSNDGDDEGIHVSNNGNVGIGVANPTAQFQTSGVVVHESLAGSGTRMVVVDEDGTLSTQSIPSVVPTSRSSSTGHSINSASYSGGNSVLNDITLEDIPAGTYLVQYSLVFSGNSEGSFIVQAGGSNVAVSERAEATGNVSGMAVVTLGSTGDIRLLGRKTTGGSGFTVTHRTLTAVATN
ncbi:MAG: hypothetical protein H6601_05150 [Flavobacteriales bacterium]|nr:hypothetical protein [Flavobacteriales bacterium]